MDPRDRLWALLIFPHCDPHDLLALRGVCRAFLAQLNAAPPRLWRPLMMTVARMSYAERMLGWAGVEQAQERERITRANCDAGRFVRGSAVRVESAGLVLVVCGRVAAFSGDHVTLFDAASGAWIARIDVTRGFGNHTVVCDRWIALGARGGSALLVDCARACLIKPPGPSASTFFITFSSSGTCFSTCTPEQLVVRIFCIRDDGDDGDDGTTLVQPVARVSLLDAVDVFALCQRGKSYLLLDAALGLGLVDVASGATIRSFAPPPDSRIYSFDHDGACDFVWASLSVNASIARAVMFRISDGYCSNAFGVATSAVVSSDGRFVASPRRAGDGCVCVDGATGAVLYHCVGSALSDQSGALLWRARNGSVKAAGSPQSDIVTLEGVSIGIDASFHYGVVAMQESSGYTLLLLNRLSGSDSSEPASAK